MDAYTKSVPQINEEDFHRLLALYRQYEWLDFEPSALFELWCMADNNTQKTLIEFLISNFCYIDAKSLNFAAYQILNQIESVWQLSSSNTYLVAKCDNANPDGSQYLLQNIKNKFAQRNGWTEFSFINSLPVAANKINSGSNIILLDDFIGTGYTIVRKYRWLLKVLEKRKVENCTIKIVSLAAMAFAEPNICRLNIDYFSCFWLKKGITESVREEKVEEFTKAMEGLEMKLEEVLYGRKIPNFGFERSESLFALENNNIPNNVFPLFWWTELKGKILRRTLFKRIN